MTRIPRTYFSLPCLTVAVLGLLTAVGAVRADDASTPEQGAAVAPASDSLDDELLKELEEGHPAGQPAPSESAAREKPDNARPADKPADNPELDEELMRELGEVGEEGVDEADRLVRLAHTMREVEERLSRSKSDNQTRELQSKIVADLDQMIQEALKRARRSQSQSQSSSSDQQKSQRSKVSQPGQPQQGKQGQEHQDQQPASDSTERLAADQVARPDPREVRDVIKHLWGHLPAREREMMLNASIEQFLPKYELLIEQYFRRLAEEQHEE
jgi:hypothetical protein